ncbi:MAG: hypothetical protein H0X66_11100 [Verrucomicrobia bacterium]|nr:hypothetical protein [Verrucomicrobiota bacterium]
MLSLAGLFLLLAGGLLLLNWTLDPLQFYRKANYPPHWTEQRRYQNPAIARTYEYSAVVIGTSVSQPLSRDRFREAFGFETINFAMEGSSAHGQRLMLDCALRSKKGNTRVQQVFMELNYLSLRGTPDWISSYDGKFPAYLYDSNEWNDIPHYLLNLDTTKSSVKIILSRLGLRSYPNKTLDDLVWRPTRPYGRQSVEKGWQRASSRRAMWDTRMPELTIAQLNASFEENIYSALQQNPDVEFYLYFPPFSIVLYDFLNSLSPEIAEVIIQNRQHVFDRVQQMPNVKLFDFQSVVQVISALEEYCDPIHYGPEVANYMIDSMQRGDHLASQVGLDEFRSWMLLPEPFSQKLQLAGWLQPAK